MQCWHSIDFRWRGDSGQVFEQTILSDNDGQLLRVRRVKVQLEQPPRDGDGEIFILTTI